MTLKASNIAHVWCINVRDIYTWPHVLHASSTLPVLPYTTPSASAPTAQLPAHLNRLSPYVPCALPYGVPSLWYEMWSTNTQSTPSQCWW